jgi:ParB/RepB/Spo0J family partition protein
MAKKTREEILAEEAAAAERRRQAAEEISKSRNRGGQAVFGESIIAQQKATITRLEGELAAISKSAYSFEYPSEIEVTPLANRRERFLTSEAFYDLIESIKTSGQKHAIQVRVNSRGSGPKYQLVSGRRRLEACRILGIEVKVEIVEADDNELRKLQLIENFREDLGCFEEAASLYDLKQSGIYKSDSEMARELGVSKAKVSLLLKVHGIPDILKEKVLTHTSEQPPRTIDGAAVSVTKTDVAGINTSIEIGDAWNRLSEIMRTKILNSLNEPNNPLSNANSLSERISAFRAILKAKKTKTSDAETFSMERDFKHSGKAIGALKVKGKNLSLKLKHDFNEEQVRLLEDFIQELIK